MIIHLHPSSTTPPPPQFAAAVEAALSFAGATRDGDEGGVLLSDGAEFELIVDPQDDIALATVWTVTDAVAQALWAVLEATGSFMLVGDWAGRTPAGGGVLASFALAFPDPYDITDYDEFSRILSDMVDAANEEAAAMPVRRTVGDVAIDAFIEVAAATPVSPAGAPLAKPLRGPPKPPLLRRLSDALFGKSI